MWKGGYVLYIEKGEKGRGEKDKTNLRHNNRNNNNIYIQYIHKTLPIDKESYMYKYTYT